MTSNIDIDKELVKQAIRNYERMASWLASKLPGFKRISLSDIYDGCGVQPGLDDCPLCAMYHYIYTKKARACTCEGCPIKEFTGKIFCFDTPYEVLSDIDFDSSNYVLHLLKKEVEFLNAVLIRLEVGSGD